MHRHRLGSVVITLAAFTWAACAPAPRQRPLPTQAINEGPNSTYAVRKQFEGNWTLVSYAVSTEDGRQVTVDAGGDLTFDAYGVLKVQYQLSDEGQKQLASLGVKSPNPYIATSGNVVIDTQRQQITYLGDDFNAKALGFDPTLAAERANPFALERVRYYAFGADGTLTLSTKYSDGKEAAVSHWRRAQ